MATLYGAEVSVFDAGNLNSISPYGLTENEKILLEQRQEIEKISRDFAKMRSDYNRIDEQMQGVRSVLEGTTSKVGQSDAQTKSLQNQFEMFDEKLNSLSSALSDLKDSVKENREIQEANNERIRVVLTELSSLIDSINSNYTPKSQMQTLEQKVESLESHISKLGATKKSDLESKEGAVLIEEALASFNEGQLDEARIRYEILVTKNYMPARSNYFLGEIAYKKEQWRTAIKHYKVSIDLYDKADYIPRLLYHTAISFDKIGESANATPFYNALKTNYPDSKEAKASPSR
ncbi:MAG: hypothetical protein GX780_05725 [Campylobacteraceae bacterium]|nr:hypothetical protein [Campylobacteraceae bacterium]